MSIKKINKVGIVGAGTMGRRIAYGCVIKGKETRLYDIAPEALKSAQQAIQVLIEERIAQRKLPEDILEKALSLLSVKSSLSECVRGVDLVVETVPESLELKRKVFAEIDRYADPETIIGTNTSSIPGSRLADVTSRPEKVFNFNWGPPDDLKVEVMGNPQTSAEIIEAVLNFLEELGMIPILVKKEILGYATNRIWRAIKKECLFLIAGGYISAEDIDRGWMLEWGTSLGPCGLMDIVGLDVVHDIEMIYYNESKDPSDKPPQFLVEMIKAGKLGVKSGEGFYKYPNPAYKQPNFIRGKKES